MIRDELVMNKICLIRGQKVMLDRDLAELYGVETKVLNQAVRRNAGGFPGDFMFQLTASEFENLKSQSVTSSWGGIRNLPYAFTGYGDLGAVIHIHVIQSLNESGKKIKLKGGLQEKICYVKSS